MTVRNLEFLFRPQSIAVVAEPGAASRYADVVLGNLAAGGFAGPVMAVGASMHSLFGIGVHLHLDELAQAPDLAIVCAALGDVPRIVARLGARGTRAVIVGPSLRQSLSDGEMQAARQGILDAARPYLMRVLGPGSGGLLVPAGGLNASVSPAAARPGRIALITQSAAVAAAVLDRAASKGIGFSTVVHLGASVDVDLADVLDWLAADPDTEAVLVQFESVAAGRKFMSAARAAARNKPVVAIRGGRGGRGEVAGKLPFAADEVYEAALRRAGWVRIDTLDDLFDAAEAMARARPMRGERLGIVVNGRGLGRLAADAVLCSGGQLEPLSADTARHLQARLHSGAPVGNPLALPADTTPQNWAAALTTLLADPEIDAVLTVYSPSPFAAGAEIATAICEVAQNSERNVFTCWIGGATMLEAQGIAAAHGVLSHESPEKAVAIFHGIVNYERNRALLAQMPPSLAEDFTADLAAARAAVAAALDADAAILPAPQVRRLLHAYGIDSAAPTAPAGGVALRLGVADDAVFGPLIFLGPVIGGCVVALPPLNLALARDLVTRSRFAAAAAAEQRGALEAAVCATLVRLSQLLADVDEVAGIELNPLQVDLAGVWVGDARIRIEKRGRKLGFRRFALRPYPKELERQVDWGGRSLSIRPIRPEDETSLGDLLGALDAEDSRMRFFGAMRSLPRSQLARFTQIDYDREMALVALESGADGVRRMLGEARAVADPDNRVADFAIVVASAIKGQGLGRLLLQSLIDHARSRGTGELRGETLVGNLRMQHLARDLGFELKSGGDIGVVELRLALRAAQETEPAARRRE